MKFSASFLRGLRTACVLVVCVGLAAAPTIAQDGVELQLRLERGEALYFATSVSLQSSIQFAGVPPTTTSVQVEGRNAMRVLDTEQDGTMLVEAVIEDLRVTADDQTTESIDEPSVFRIRRDGRVVEWKIKPAVLTPFEGLEGLPSALPGRPVKVGDSWTAPFTMQAQGIRVQATTTYTLTGIESGSQGNVAHIRVRTQGTAQPDQLPPMPSGFQVQVNGVLGSTGELEWLVERGRMGGSHEDGTIEIRMHMTGGGQTFDGTVAMQYSMRISALAPDSVVAPAIPPERLIIPGKSVGDISLDTALSDLGAKFGGPPEMLSADAFKVSRASWRDQPFAAYPDPEEQNRMLGLDVTDKQYRTDEGIGFGSSRGAVLFAHGMAPTVVELMVPAGGVQVLVYNDQGIAFVLTSDAQHAHADGTHAPIGAVDWITIFRPGDAGKIFNSLK